MPCWGLWCKAAGTKGILKECREVPAVSLSQGGQGGVLGEEKQVGLEQPQRRWPQRPGLTQVALEL